MAFPTSFTEALQPHADELISALGKAGNNLRRWQQVIGELERLQGQHRAVAVLHSAIGKRLADAQLGAQQMRDVIAGLEPLVDAIVAQGPPTLGVLPALAWPIVAGVFIVAGYGAIDTIADAATVISENEVKVSAYETQLGLAREVAEARRDCTGPKCAELDQTFQDIVTRDPNEAKGWPWWVWALVLGLPVLGGIVVFVSLSDDGRQARGSDNRGRR